MPSNQYVRPHHRVDDSHVCVGQPDVYVHGITSINCTGGLRAQTTEVLALLDKALAEAGASKASIAHLSITLAGGQPSVSIPAGKLISDYVPDFYEPYRAWVPNPAPPRTVQWGGLDKQGALIEISAIASRTYQ